MNEVFNNNVLKGGMSLSLIKSNTDIKEIKNVINKNVASSFRTQPSFVELLKLNGCPALKVGVIGSEIRQQLIMEAENGELTLDSVMPRAYTLIGEYLEIKNIRTYDDLDNYKAISIRQTGFDAMLPYTASGVQYGCCIHSVAEISERHFGGYEL